MFQTIKKKFSWWNVSHIADYGIVLLFLVVIIVIETTSDPHRMFLPFSSENPTVSYPLRNSTVPNWSAVVLAYLAPTSAFISVQIPVLFGKTTALGFGTWSTPVHELHHSILGLSEAAALNSFITGVAKEFAGRYRPNYIALKNTGREDLEREGRKSFPSGHSSTAFCGMTFLTLWLIGKLKIFHPNSPTEFWKIVIVVAPELCALLVAISRVRDFHHNFSDVIAGAIIGVSIACLTYFALFNSLRSKRCGIPKSRQLFEEQKPLTYSSSSSSSPSSSFLERPLIENA